MKKRRQQLLRRFVSQDQVHIKNIKEKIQGWRGWWIQKPIAEAIVKIKIIIEIRRILQNLKS